MSASTDIRRSRTRLLCIVMMLAFRLMPTGLEIMHAQELKSADRRTYTEALAHYNSRNFKQAAVLLRRVASHNPKAAEPQFWLGMTAVADGFNTAGIRRYFGRCIELDPDYPHPLAHYYMGVIHYTDARYDEAVAELDRYFALAEGSGDRATMAAYEEASNYLYWSQFLAEAQLNAAPFDPHRVAGVSSRHDEIMPTLSPDGSTFYYLRRLPTHKERTFYARELEETSWQLCSSRWLDSTYSAGTPLPHPFNSGRLEGSVSVTADGTELYYSVITDNGGYANSDIWCCRRLADGQWGEPEALGRHINDPDSWESQPSVSADGRLLIFASNRRGGQGGTDLWRCRRLPNGDWSRPENLGSAINTAAHEKMPFLAADGHTLYFLSNGWQGFGGYDIYFADLNDRFGNRPTNLGLPINTEDDEGGFGVTTDGRRAYFAGRTDGSRSTDILMFDLYPAARPEPMRLCTVTLLTPRSQRDTLLILPEQEPTVVTLDADGCLPAIVKDHKATRLRNHETRRLNDSLSVIDLTDPLVVDALAAWLLSHPRVYISVECPKADDALTAYSRLVAAGIRAERLSHRSGTAVPQPRILLISER